MNTLNGLRILNTRPQEQALSLNQEILKVNGISIDFPTLKIKATSPNWIKSLPDLNDVEIALFISANAVKYTFTLLEKNKRKWPEQIHVIAIGQSTAQALEHKGIRVTERPLLPDSEHVLKLPSLQQIKHKKLILFKGEGGRPLIEEYLQAQRAQLIVLSVYKRALPTINHQFSNSLWREDAVDIILLTSEESIHNLFKLFSQEAHGWLKNKPCVVISERLAQTALTLGIKKIKIGHPNRIINTLLEYKDYIHGGQQ